MRIEQKNNQIDVFITENIKLDKVRSIRFDASLETVPTIQVEVIAMDDQTFEVANEKCGIEVYSDCLRDFPAQMLSNELKRRGVKIG